MIRLLRRINRLKSFQRAELSEVDSDISNPCRGWFSLYAFVLDREPDLVGSADIKSDESMVLLLADIGEYRNQRLGEEVFLRLERIINHFSDNGKDIILRVAYDHEGKGMEREPGEFSRVLEHAAQIAEFVKEHSEKIFLYQGLLIGRWGEMHTSKFSGEDKLRAIYSVFEEILDQKVFTAVRKPVQWRMIRPQPDGDGTVRSAKLGIFNDGMFGSESDLGTFDCSNKENTKWRTAWNRENETQFMREIGQFAPIGGEALLGEGFFSAHGAEHYIKELKALNVTYLNRYHDIKLIEKWKKSTYSGKGVWNGKNVFDYIGAHLGYRFVILKTEIQKEAEGIEVTVTVENSGFANLYETAELYLETDGKEGRKVKTFGEKLNACFAGTIKDFKLKTEMIRGRICIFALRTKDKKEIFFANRSVAGNGRVFVGEIKE